MFAMRENVPFAWPAMRRASLGDKGAETDETPSRAETSMMKRKGLVVIIIIIIKLGDRLFCSTRTGERHVKRRATHHADSTDMSV